MSIYEFMEDHDNSELSESEWEEQMEWAIEDFYAQYPPNGRKMSISGAISNYKSWKREKYAPEQ